MGGNQWVTYQPDARIQEGIGNRLLAVQRLDAERLTQLAQRWRDVSNDALTFAEGRNARLQEAIGLSIATTARLLYDERSSLDTALSEAQELLGRVRSGAWFQERLGEVIVQTATAVPPNTPRFAEQLLSRMRVLSEMERRTAINTDALVVSLSARRAQLPREGITRLVDAVADGHRVSRFYDASVDAQMARVMGEISDAMVSARSLGNTQPGAEARSSWNARGFLEFGAAALLGAIAVMAWVALSTASVDHPALRGSHHGGLRRRKQPVLHRAGRGASTEDRDFQPQADPDAGLHRSVDDPLHAAGPDREHRRRRPRQRD